MWHQRKDTNLLLVGRSCLSHPIALTIKHWTWCPYFTKPVVSIRSCSNLSISSLFGAQKHLCLLPAFWIQNILEFIKRIHNSKYHNYPWGFARPDFQATHAKITLSTCTLGHNPVTWEHSISQIIKYSIFVQFMLIFFALFNSQAISSYILTVGMAWLKSTSGIHELKYWPRNATGFFFI